MEASSAYLNPRLDIRFICLKVAVSNASMKMLTNLGKGKSYGSSRNLLVVLFLQDKIRQFEAFSTNLARSGEWFSWIAKFSDDSDGIGNIY